jgi:quinol monooxygenase YgiN
MYAVIFRAKPGVQDEEYGKTVARMRELAFDKYGCLDFIAVTEGDQEVAISYWENE